MEDKSIWPPKPKNQMPLPAPAPKQYLFVWVPLLAVGAGCALGIWDTFRADSIVTWVTVVIAAILGYLHPKTAPLSVFILSLGLYLAHVAAIQHGVQHPYVERDVDSAIACWESLFPNGLGGFVGALAKIFVQYEEVGPRNP